jgi:hypothetical protein
MPARKVPINAIFAPRAISNIVIALRVMLLSKLDTAKPLRLT